MFNHMFDIAFEVESDNDWENVMHWEFIEALEKRLKYLKENRNEAMEAFGYSDSYEIEPIGPKEA